MVKKKKKTNKKEKRKKETQKVCQCNLRMTPRTQLFSILQMTLKKKILQAERNPHKFFLSTYAIVEINGNIKINGNFPV